MGHNNPKPSIASLDSIAGRSGSMKTMNKNAERGLHCVTWRLILKLADKKPFISITAFESKYNVSMALTENSSRLIPFEILMKNDLSTLSNALEKSTFTAHEPQLLFAFLFQANTRVDGFLQLCKGLSIIDYIGVHGRYFCVSVFETNRAKIVYCYFIFRLREQLDYC